MGKGRQTNQQQRTPPALNRMLSSFMWRPHDGLRDRRERLTPDYLQCGDVTASESKPVALAILPEHLGAWERALAQRGRVDIRRAPAGDPSDVNRAGSFRRARRRPALMSRPSSCLRIWLKPLRPGGT